MIIIYLFIFSFIHSIYFQVRGDRYYLGGIIKIPFDRVKTLKGMNSNYLTSTKEFDYRFISRLIMDVFSKEELIAGCVKMDGSSSRGGNIKNYTYFHNLFRIFILILRPRFNYVQGARPEEVRICEVFIQ